MTTSTTYLKQFATTRAVWRGDKIIHVRAFTFVGPAKLRRLGIQRLPSDWRGLDHDTVTAFRVLAWDGSQWRVVREEKRVPFPEPGAPLWFDLAGLETSALQIEALESALTGKWTGWTLASEVFLLEGEAPLGMWSAVAGFEAEAFKGIPADTVELAADTRLDLTECRPARGAELLPGEVRFRSRQLEVGFRLGRAGFRYLSVDDEGQGHTGRNLLQMSSIIGNGAAAQECWTQGPRLQPVGAPRAVGILEHNVRGTVAVRGRTVQYDLEIPSAGQQYRLHWEVLADRLRLTAERVGEQPLRAWTSSAWQIAFDSRVTAATNLGRVTRTGEAGLVDLPVLLHAPGFGTLRVNAHGRPAAASWRADSIRPQFTTTSELKLGEQAQPEGDYLLLSGRHKTELEFVVTQHKLPVRRGTPQVVQRALNRCSLTGLTYRPDTATFSNNGNSTHAIVCADNWSALVPHIGRILPNLQARDLLRDSLARHLNGGPCYGVGAVIENGKRQSHLFEDEMVQSCTALLLALAESGLEWDAPRQRKIAAELTRMRARDVDGDGLIESPHRRGISGQHQWATNWWDALSFGWKDAFANAQLYAALVRIGEKAWAQKLRKSFWTAFYNEQTGWFAGWRCQENKLHDYGFLFVNGAAVCHGLVEAQPAREIIGRLWAELQRLGPPDYRMGLPGNLWNIPYKDEGHAMAEGIYENKALTISMARHFVGALYKVGMTREGDTLLHAMLETLGNGTAFGGCGSGIDWRRWDGTPCGYEGLLCDQFGILAVAAERYAKTRKV